MERTVGSKIIGIPGCQCTKILNKKTQNEDDVTNTELYYVSN